MLLTIVNLEMEAAMQLLIAVTALLTVATLLLFTVTILLRLKHNWEDNKMREYKDQYLPIIFEYLEGNVELSVFQNLIGSNELKSRAIEEIAVKLIKNVEGEEAEKLKDSSEWKTTTDKLINLQKKWKETGPVPNKESDKLWKRFRAACDHFFTRKSNYFSGDSEAHVENLKLKQALIERVKAHNPSSKFSDLITDIEQYQNEYYEIGFVPIEKKDVIRDEFRHAIEDLIERSELTKDQQSLIRFRVKIKGILSSPKSNNKIAFERDKLVNKLQSLRNDLSVLENNVGFFKQTSSSEDTINDFQKKIDDSKARIDLLENKIDIIDELDPID